MTGLFTSRSVIIILWGANPFLTVEFYLTVGLLVSVLLGGAVVFYFVDRWRKRQFSPGRDSTETLTSFRRMFEQGELTDAEYRKVRDRISAQMREEVSLPSLNSSRDSPTQNQPELTPPQSTSDRSIAPISEPPSEDHLADQNT